MKELLGIFKPEVSPIHKVDFSVVAQVKPVVGLVAGTVIKAGTVVSGEFLLDTSAPAEVVVATGGAIKGVLMHDIIVDEVTTAETRISAGIMVEGVVYGDIMTEVNAWYAPADIDALYLVGIKTYGAKTK